VLTRLVNSTGFIVNLTILEQPIRFADPLSIRITSKPITNLIFNESTGTAKLSEAVEIAEQPSCMGRQDGWIGLLAKLHIPLFRYREQYQVDSQHYDLGAAALRGNSHVQPGVALLWSKRLCEEGVPAIRAGRRENAIMR